jgi:hypothetical protein
MLMARNRRNSQKEYWSNDVLLNSKMFSATMARDRFLSVLRMLHFSNNKDQTEGDRLHKVRGLFDKFLTIFQDSFILFQDLCVDESLVLFKGRLNFKQYIKTKRHRFGIKLYLLCDCETGYVSNFRVYTGKDTNIELNPDLGVSGSVVTTLIAPYLNEGHTVYTDNWYTSPALSLFLHKLKTNSCGTVRGNRKGMPSLSRKLLAGEVQSVTSDSLMAIKWCDRRDVRMLSTLHSDEIVNTGKRDWKTKEPIMKPKCIVDYSCKMGAVDRTDMLLSSVQCIRKSVKWHFIYLT